VNVSTDKAVNPSSVMGASKRLAECVVKDAANGDGTHRTYVSVRFGNVLGSRGSVIPLFREQIAAGGPVTVTDPEMTRYFMTIPEAVQLVLQAGALAEPGAVYFLDMGQPVRIAQLAEDMIRLSGCGRTTTSRSSTPAPAPARSCSRSSPLPQRGLGLGEDSGAGYEVDEREAALGVLSEVDGEGRDAQAGALEEREARGMWYAEVTSSTCGAAPRAPAAPALPTSCWRSSAATASASSAVLRTGPVVRMRSGATPSAMASRRLTSPSGAASGERGDQPPVKTSQGARSAAISSRPARKRSAVPAAHAAAPGRCAGGRLRRVHQTSKILDGRDVHEP
jgi:hypothetical protein